MKINKEDYYDKVKACWLSKSIGGTMGAPYEGNHSMQNITGYNTPKGEPVPNDDLDIQLIWLSAVEDMGIRGISSRVLGEYWINYVTMPCNEYGVCKANMEMGLLPPYSGEYKNDIWKHSNGGWIRTELWACLFPGVPELAAKYAYKDSCIDHGKGEGTYAAMFVAAMQSIAFVEKDIRKIIEAGLKYIPDDCRCAKAAKTAIELYDKKVSLTEARNTILQADGVDLNFKKGSLLKSAQCGWFLAPGNVSFVVLGLLYGEGDYKKTVINAINCGDDTDCTGGTAASIMGIIGGCKNVPKDWADYIGDQIITTAIDSFYHRTPKNCTELTERVCELMPASFKAHSIDFEYTDGETEIDKDYFIRVPDFTIPSTGLSVDFADLTYAKGRVEFDKCEVEPGDEITVKCIFKISTDWNPLQLNFKFELPDGWSCNKEYCNLYLMHSFGYENSVEVKIVVGEHVELLNKVYITASCCNRPSIATIPLIIMGK